MLKWRQALSCVFLLVAGCRTPSLESIDQSVANYASRPFDVAPVRAGKPAAAPLPTDGAAARAATSSDGVPSGEARPASTIPLPQVDQAKAVQVAPPQRTVMLASAQVAEEPTAGGQTGSPLRKFDLKIPSEVPGSETPGVTLSRDRAERERSISRLYPQLPPLAEEPVARPGPTGRPYTLEDLQRLAAANSPVLRQAAADVEHARGILQQARTYANPTMGISTNPNANNTSSGTYGAFVDQVITTGGKLKLAAAAAETGLRTAELALTRARSDLATRVRTAYYNLLVTRETVRVNKALAHFTDEVYRLQVDLLAVGVAASHEPAALRSQVFVVRLAYKQAINDYVYAWKQIVSAVGLPQLPFSAVEGQVDRLIPYYDYDILLTHVLRNHTDVFTARYNVAGARYILKLAQITPVPDVEVNGGLWQETQVVPRMEYFTSSLNIKVPLWDQNKGNIRAAAAGLVRAGEGPHQVELALTTGLATAYASYKDNLAAVEYYRRQILPDQVRFYRGVFQRRQIDPAASFNDLVTAQQTLVADVTAYLGILGTLWTSVVTVADFLQTDDFYQLGKPLELPPLPDLDALHGWPCPHPQPDLAPSKADQKPDGGNAVNNPTQGDLNRRPAVVEPVAFVSPSRAVPSVAQLSTSPPRPLNPNPLPPASNGPQAPGPPATTHAETAILLPR
jgi:cobalt-zinc-cadmium efflux system outer membrane protein